MLEAGVLYRCQACGKEFTPKFRFQTELAEGGAVRAWCSQSCRMRRSAASGTQPVACSACGKSFVPRYAAQSLQVAGQSRYACTPQCRAQVIESAPRPALLRKIAILNQKGGTGKTTTAVNLAAGLAQAGRRVLLIDMDSQGSVGVSLGISGEQTIYHVLVDGIPPQDAAVPIRANLDVITSSETVASAEIVLTNTMRREKVLAERCAELSGYDYVILDCAPALSIVNQNALTFAESVLIPVSCDYLSMVGVKQILKTLHRIEEVLLHPVRVLGVVPTFYDARARITHEVIASLKHHFGEKLMPPIRVNTRLKEAPSHKKTIYEYAPSSTAAADYSRLTERVEAVLAGAEPPATRLRAAS